MTYDGNDDSAEEIVEADEHALEGDWFIFKRYLPGHSLTTVLRIKAASVKRIQVEDLGLGAPVPPP